LVKSSTQVERPQVLNSPKENGGWMVWGHCPQVQWIRPVLVILKAISTFEEKNLKEMKTYEA
jgi:hypothetical protein